jgi:16S rRNA processing protein RimM
MGHDGYYPIGYTSRTHGVKGNVMVKLDVDDPRRYSKLKTIYLEQGGSLHPFSVTSVSIAGDHAIIGLAGIGDMDAAEKLMKCGVYLPLKELPPLKGTKLYLHEAIGMKVLDKSLGELGTIDQVFDLPEQPVARVLYQEKEVLFPLISAFILKVDRQLNELHVDLPEGLVDIYLQV